jgi:hypothetical protein
MVPAVAFSIRTPTGLLLRALPPNMSPVQAGQHAPASIAKRDIRARMRRR